MKLYIGFSYPKAFKPLAYLIRAVEARDYDHVYIRIQEPLNKRPMIFQASGLQVNMIEASKFASSNNIIKEYAIDIIDAQYNAVWDFVMNSLGTPYSLIEDFGILLMKIFHLKNQPFSQGMSAEFCSKLGAQVCQLLGLPIPENADIVDPTLLDSILFKLNIPFTNHPDFSA